MKKLKFNYKFTNYNIWFNPLEFQQISRFGLIGRRIGEVTIVNEVEPRLDSVEEALVCQVCNCLKENDQPLEILLFTDYLEDYSRFIHKEVTADLGNFYCPAWQEIPTYQVVGLRIVGE